MSVLAVDLGTSNTVAVLSAHDRPPRVVEVEGSATMPSAVFAGDDGRLVVGREAERRARLNPARFEPNPKRRVDEGTLLLGDRVVPVSEAFAAVLGKVAEETSRQLGGAKPDEVRLTHPAQWGPVRRNVLLSAARQAGLGTNLVLIPEPVAAAAHFASFPGRTLTPGQALAVYDLGAGTFDVAIVGVTQTGFTVLAEAGLPDLGGLDVDQALVQHVGSQVSHRDPHAWQRLMMPQSTADRRAQRALREDVRAAKEALSGHPQTDMPLPEPFHDVLITRAELETLIRPNLVRSAELLGATIRQAGLSPDRLAGVYLVGGSSRIPLVATLISEQLRIVATNLDQPETAVALGAHHVPQAGTAMRTANIANVVAAVPLDQPMTSGAPPRHRPHAGQVPETPPKPPVHGTWPSPIPPRFDAPPSSTKAGRARTGSRRTGLWLFLGACAVVLVLLVTWIIPLIRDNVSGSLPLSDDEKPPARPKKTPSSADCERLISDSEISDVLGIEVGLENSVESSDYSICDWPPVDSLDHEFNIGALLDAGEWAYGEEGITKPAEFDGNLVHTRKDGSDCRVAVRIGKRTEVEAWVKGGEKEVTDPCSAALEILEIVYGNLPDA
jgi:molecular chaperone DnaK